MILLPSSRIEKLVPGYIMSDDGLDCITKTDTHAYTIRRVPKAFRKCNKDVVSSDKPQTRRVRN